MDYRIAICCGFIALQGVACQGEATEERREAPRKVEVELSEALPGTWEAVSIEVDIQSFDNTDSSFLFTIEEGSWGEKFGAQPTRTIFDYNNKFLQEYRTSNGELVNANRGIWNTFGDTLLLVDRDTTYQYLVEVLDNGLARWQSTVDWDGDGVIDDDYVGTHRRISRQAPLEE